MEEYLTIQNILVIIVLLLFYIAVTLSNIYRKIAEVREDTGLFKVQFIPKDKW